MILQEAPAIVKSYYDKRIVGCPGGEGGKLIWFSIPSLSHGETLLL